MEPGEYNGERDLHDLLIEDPSILPTDDLDEPPRLVPIGYETALGSGYADAIFLGVDGTVTICEVKLRRNAESRREVLAQALSYAAFLEGFTVEQFTEQVAHPFCEHIKRGDLVGRSIVEIVTDLAGATDEDVLVDNLANNLMTGEFRVIIVVDEVHPQLRKSVAYVNRHATFDVFLVEVGIRRSADGTHEVLQPRMLDVPSTGDPPPRVKRTPQDWLEAAVQRNPEGEGAIRRLFDRLVELQRQGLIELAAGSGVSASLKVFVAGTTKSILWLWQEGNVTIPRYTLPKLGVEEAVIEGWIARLASVGGTPQSFWHQSRQEPQVVPVGGLRDTAVVDEVLAVVTEAAEAAARH